LLHEAIADLRLRHTSFDLLDHVPAVIGDFD
jgi:hypothetical protein